MATVKESFVGRVGDTDLSFRSGDVVDDNSPAVKKWPHLFTNEKTPLTAAIETAAKPKAK